MVKSLALAGDWRAGGAAVKRMTNDKE